jgi:hypothetical protein
VLQVRLLLGATKALSSRGSIFLAAIVTALFGKSTSIFSLSFGDTLCLCFLVRFLLGLLFGFLLCSYLGLFSLNF